MAFVTSTAMTCRCRRHGLVVGNHTRDAVHRHSRVFVGDTKGTPMVASGVITVSVVKVWLPLRPVPIVIRRKDVDLAGDGCPLLNSGNVLPVTLAEILVRSNRWTLDNDVHQVLLDQLKIVAIRFSWFDSLV